MIKDLIKTKGEEISVLEGTDRLQYLIDLAKEASALDDRYKVDQNKIFGCASNLWVVGEKDNGNMQYQFDADAFITKGTTKFVIDILKVDSKQNNQYDLPYYYFGQIISTSFEYQSPKNLSVLGSKNGYQHLWKEAQGKANSSNIQFTWMSNKKFYSITSLTEKSNDVILGRIGANDPKFNLRKEPTLILRKKNTKNTVFASVIESHGSYNPVTESAKNAYSIIKKVELVYDSKEYTAVRVVTKNERSKILIIVNTDASKAKEHTIKINNKEFSWIGPYTLK